jgi:hypothetical protein
MSRWSSVREAARSGHFLPLLHERARSILSRGWQSVAMSRAQWIRRDARYWQRAPLRQTAAAAVSLLLLSIPSRRNRGVFLRRFHTEVHCSPLTAKRPKRARRRRQSSQTHQQPAQPDIRTRSRAAPSGSLDRAEVARALVDQGGFGPAEGVRAVGLGIQTNRTHPFIYEPCVFARGRSLSLAASSTNQGMSDIGLGRVKTACGL